jgi:hypothetical protein
MNARILVLLALALTASLAHAELVYKWTDDKGRVHYSDMPPEGRPSKAVEIDVREPSDADRKAAEDRAARNKEKSSQPVAAASAPPAGKVPSMSPPQTAPGDTSACQAEWDAYLKSTECFGPYVNANGSIRPEAFKVCTEVPQPREPCKR